jgi:hypothetical protein
LDLARIYALKGDKEKAYHYLEQYNSKNYFHYSEIVLINIDPFFNSIREEEQFKHIVRNMEIKHEIGRERAIVWLEENDLL